MPATYKIDTSGRVVLSSAHGVLTDADVLAHREALGADPDFEPSFSQLYDFRAVSEFKITPDVVRALARSSIFDAGSREALVMTSDLGYGFARMFQTVSTGPQRTVNIFRDIAEARRWLELD